MCGCTSVRCQPVITSNTTSLPEVVGDAAVMVNPLSIEEIAHAMKQMVEQPEMRNVLITQGLIQAEKFTWQQTSQHTQNVYRGMSV